MVFGFSWIKRTDGMNYYRMPFGLNEAPQNFSDVIWNALWFIVYFPFCIGPSRYYWLPTHQKRRAVIGFKVQRDGGQSVLMEGNSIIVSLNCVGKSTCMQGNVVRCIESH